jgi:hypothetical protein
MWIRILKNIKYKKLNFLIQKKNCFQHLTQALEPNWDGTVKDLKLYGKLDGSKVLTVIKKLYYLKTKLF